MGMRMTSAWKLPASLPRPRAAAKDPNPTPTLIPLNNKTAVQALCNRMNSKLVKVTAHIRGLAAVVGAMARSDEILVMDDEPFGLTC